MLGGGKWEGEIKSGEQELIALNVTKDENTNT